MNTNNNILEISPIGSISSQREDIQDDHWGSVISTIQLDSNLFQNEATKGLDTFSHLDVVFYMHKVVASKIQTGARHPRNQTKWPQVGILAQRTKNRPNQIGLSTCRIVKVVDLEITVQGLDAIDGTPVLDIKPYMKEFAPREETRQPSWSSELMAQYFD